MIDRLDITDECSVNCDFILNTVIFIDAALNISLRKIWKCNVLSFYLFGQGVPNVTKGTINLKSLLLVKKYSFWNPPPPKKKITKKLYITLQILQNTVKLKSMGMQKISDKMFFDIIANMQKKNITWKVDGYNIR